MAAYIYKTRERAEAAKKRKMKMQRYKGLKAHILQYTSNGKVIGYSVLMY